MTQRRDGSPVQFRVLGPIEAVVNWLPVDVGPPQRRLLLGLLLLQPGEPVPVERLIDLTWKVPPPRARRAVFAHVARLRKALAGPDGPAKLRAEWRVERSPRLKSRGPLSRGSWPSIRG